MLSTNVKLKLKTRGITTETLIGRGAFGNVYSCRKSFSRKKYAVKMVEFGDDYKIRWQTENEIEILKEIGSHANIVRFHDVVRDDHVIIMMLEYIPGSGFLEGILNWPHFEENSGKTVIKQLLDALKYCHSRRIMHRDVCPDNIMWYDVPTVKRPHVIPTVKLIDFNLSRRLPEHLYHIRADALGNPSYMAPECLKEEPITTLETDLWSVGVILFIVLAGYPPFFNNNYKHLLQNIIEGNYVLPQELWNHVSADGQELLKRMLVVDYKIRPNAKELLKDKWFYDNQQKDTRRTNSKLKARLWPGQLRLKAFLQYLYKQKTNSSHRKYVLVHKDRTAFIPEQEMLELPLEITEKNFYNKNFILDTANTDSLDSQNSLDENNNNVLELKRQFLHW